MAARKYRSMEHIKVILDKFNNYVATEETSWNMLIIGNFFTHDVKYRIKYWIESFNESNDSLFSAGGNWALLEKDAEGYVIMTDVVTDYDYDPEPVPLEQSLRIKPSELIKLLYKWEELYTKKVPEIMITKDGEIFDMFEIKS